MTFGASFASPLTGRRCWPPSMTLYANEKRRESTMQQAQLRRTSPSASQPNEEQPLVLIVDDDATIREALQELILSAGMQPACFASTRDLFDAGVLDRLGCLILDVRMP